MHVCEVCRMLPSQLPVPCRAGACRNGASTIPTCFSHWHQTHACLMRQRTAQLKQIVFTAELLMLLFAITAKAVACTALQKCPMPS